MNDVDLRDLFAGMAMMGMLAAARGIPIEVCTKGAYKFADAMIEEKYAETPEDGGIATVVKNVKPRNPYDIQDTN